MTRSGPTTPQPASRWVVIGNSGSGKSTLAAHLGGRLSLPIHDLDDVHWQDDGRKRDETDASVRAADTAGGDRWVIEGVYGWLARIVLPRATALIWLDLPWDDCRCGSLARGRRRGMAPSDRDALLVWAQDYWTRTTSTSFTGHERLHRSFAGVRVRLHSRDEVTAWLQHLDV